MKKQFLVHAASFFYLFILVAWLLLTACANKTDKQAQAQKRPAPPPVESFTTSRKYTSFGAESYKAWQAQVPAVKNIGIPSSLDSHIDSVLFYHSNSKKDKPLLVVLHSWSSEYLQQASIP